jgi:hypothetical protein
MEVPRQNIRAVRVTSERFAQEMIGSAGEFIEWRQDSIQGPAFWRGRVSRGMKGSGTSVGGRKNGIHDGKRDESEVDVGRDGPQDSSY